MRTLFLAFSLILSKYAYAEDLTFTPIDTPTPTVEAPTPTPTAIATNPISDSRTSSNNVVRVFLEDPNRVNAQVWVTSGSGVICSKNSNVSQSESFPITTSTYTLNPPTSSLYCIANTAASLGVVASTNQSRSYSDVISNIGASSVVVVPENPLRVRAVLQPLNPSPILYCGYSCPANPLNSFALNYPLLMEFYGNEAICCATLSGNANVVVSSEVSKK